MPRWMAYDHAAETALAQRFGGANVHSQTGDQEAILSALLAAGEAAALLPATHGESVVITRRTLREVRAGSAPPRAYEASGFLGLHDEPVFDDEPERPKSWWERFWE